MVEGAKAEFGQPETSDDIKSEQTCARFSSMTNAGPNTEKQKQSHVTEYLKILVSFFDTLAHWHGEMRT